MESFGGSVRVMDVRDDRWIMTFTVMFGKRRDRSLVCAKNLRTGEELSTPHDFSKLCELYPFEDWPPFAKNLGRNFPVSMENDERLF